MILRSTLTRLGIAAAGGALATLAATSSPAVADEWDTGAGENQLSSQDYNGAQGSTEGVQGWNNAGRDWSHDANHTPRLYEGRVTARGGLVLRDAPTRGSAVIRVEPYGAIVHIFCKTSGESVGSNNLWYLLTDGTWAWGSAKYIDNIGAAPRWC